MSYVVILMMILYMYLCKCRVYFLIRSTTLRVSRSARPTSLDGGPKSAAPVAFGKKGKDFEFSDLSLKVKFVECSARGKGAEGESVADIDEVLTWLNKQC